MRRKFAKLLGWAARVQIGRPHFAELHDLDTFSTASIKEWDAHARKQSEYQYSLFFDLEAQRAARHPDLCKALRSEPALAVPLDGWCRLTNFAYSLTPLSPAGSLRWVGQRFNFGVDIDPSRFNPFPALYVAEDFETAYREYHGLLRSQKTEGLAPDELSLENTGSWVTLKLAGIVNNVFDLTKEKPVREFCKVIGKFTISDRVREAEQAAGRSPTALVRTPRSFLDSMQDPNWRSLPVHFDVPANSQVFGKLLVDAGFEGVLYRSVKSSKRCLAVFTRQLAGSDSCIGLHGDRPAGLPYCEINSSNCSEW